MSEYQHTELAAGRWAEMSLAEQMLNIGREDAYQWALEMISDRIRDYGIDVLRIDYNTGPLDSWRDTDEPGRRGITEIRCVENFYRLWDTLHARFPGLIIDNCASGGRRLDYGICFRGGPDGYLPQGRKPEGSGNRRGDPGIHPEALPDEPRDSHGPERQDPRSWRIQGRLLPERGLRSLDPAGGSRREIRQPGLRPGERPGRGGNVPAPRRAALFQERSRTAEDDAAQEDDQFPEVSRQRGGTAGPAGPDAEQNPRMDIQKVCEGVKETYDGNAGKTSGYAGLV